MADDTIALQAKGFDPADMIAPLQAYSMLMQGQKTQIDNQQNQLALAARQSYANTLQTPGADQVAGLSASGLGAYDPEGAKTALGNVQAGNTLNALKSYTANPSNPSVLAPAGPEAVGQASTALGTQAATTGTQQDVEAKKANLRGQIALGYTKNPTDQGWHQAVAQARQAGLITDLHVYNAINNMTDPSQRMGIARQWIAAGAGSVQTSGMAAGNTAREEFPYAHIQAGPTDRLILGGAWRNGPPPPSGYADPAPVSGESLQQGRSVGFDSAPTPASPASNGSVPVAAAPGTGSRPIAGGFTGRSASPQMAMMTQLENSYGLPAGYLSGTAHVESGGRSDASNPSGAKGLFEFMPSTWARYGTPGTSPFDPVASTEAAARLAVDNQRQMSRVLGRPPTASELYLAHQQGAAGAIGLLSNPNASAASIVGAKAVISNGGTPNMTAGQFAGMWEAKFNRQGGGNFSLSGPSPMGGGVQMPSAPQAPAAALPAAGMVGLRAAAMKPPQPDLAPQVAPPVAGAPSPPPPPSSPSAPMQEGRSAGLDAPSTQTLNDSYRPFVQSPGMSPFQYEKQRLDAARAVDEEKSGRDQYVSADNAQRNLMQLQDDLSKLAPQQGDTLRDTLLRSGSGAGWRIGIAKAANTALSAGGFGPLFDPERITAAESAAKTTGRLGFDLAGGGAAGYIVNEAIGLNPSVMSTPGGAKLLIGSLLAAQQRQKDLYLFQRQYAKGNNGNPIGAEVDFDRAAPPMRYVQDAQRISRIPTPAVKYLQAHDDQRTVRAFEAKYGSGLARYYLGGGAQ